MKKKLLFSAFFVLGAAFAGCSDDEKPVDQMCIRDSCGTGLGCRCRRRGPHGARHARRRRLHECPDGGIPCLQAFGRGPYAGIPPHCPAVGTGHTPFFGRRGFPPYGPQPLQSGLGFPGRQSPQFALSLIHISMPDWNAACSSSSKSQNLGTVAISSLSSGECTPRNVGPKETISLSLIHI